MWGGTHEDYRAFEDWYRNQLQTSGDNNLYPVQNPWTGENYPINPVTGTSLGQWPQLIAPGNFEGGFETWSTDTPYTSMNPYASYNPIDYGEW